jgi:cyclohexanone monooxygenase
MPYIGGVGVYRRICEDIAAKGYEGFAMKARERVRAAAAL